MMKTRISQLLKRMTVIHQAGKKISIICLVGLATSVLAETSTNNTLDDSSNVNKDNVSEVEALESLPPTSAGPASSRSVKTPFLCQYAQQVYAEREIDLENLNQRNHSASEEQRIQSSLQNWASRVQEFCE